MLLPTLADKVSHCLTNYGSLADFSKTFSVANLQTYVRHPVRCVCGTAPTLLTASEAYGTTPIIQWLMTLLVGVSEFSGAKERITPYQLQKLANKLYDRCRDLKVTEIMLFIDKLESGDFGRISWQSFDPVAVLEKVESFRVYAEHIAQHERQRIQDEYDAIERTKAVPCPEHIKERLDSMFRNLASNSSRNDTKNDIPQL